MTTNACRLRVAADPMFKGGVVPGHDSNAPNCHRLCGTYCLGRKCGTSTGRMHLLVHRHDWDTGAQRNRGGEAGILHSKFRI